MEGLLHYQKNKRENIQRDLEASTLGVSEVQNYIPIYSRFFNLDATNNNSINLNNPLRLHSIGEETKFRTYSCYIEDQKGEKQPKSVFFKCSPLVDPIRYMVGKYQEMEHTLDLPKLDVPCNKKASDVNNSAYVDGFFSFLSSKLLHKHAMHHCIDCYDCFLAKQSDFKQDIIEDLEYLDSSPFFNENNGKLFQVDDEELREFMESSQRDSRDRKPKLALSGKAMLVECDEMDESDFDGIFTTTQSTDDNSVVVESEDQCLSATKSSRSSSCSSRYSFTDSENEESDSDEDSECGSSGTSSSSDSDVQVLASVFNFPTELIALEACTHTLDYLMRTTDIDVAQWRSILMQVIMNLLIFQKAFNFTHNDLHTNNIMYVETQREHLIYKFDGKLYKVPTFGKLFKIIDFGRSIYKFNGKTFCSDSYDASGDAAAQYNCDPYFNPAKPRLDPHYGFDLCRLGCALYDDLVPEDENECDQLAEVITSWCTDDKGKNILYKKNGEERFLDFKLYIMIARHVHNPTPRAQLTNEFFSIYTTTKKNVSRKTKIMDIDELPSYV